MLYTVLVFLLFVVRDAFCILFIKCCLTSLKCFIVLSKFYPILFQRISHVVNN